MKRTPLKRKPKPAMTAKERAAARSWRAATIVDGCAMCLWMPPEEVDVSRQPDLLHIVAHHVLPQQALKQEHLHAFLWDERNGIGLCDYHHTRHHNYIERVPRALVPAATTEFAYELELGWLLDAEYPS